MLYSFIVCVAIICVKEKKRVLRCISVATPTDVKFRIKTVFTSADCHERRAKHERLRSVGLHGNVEHVRNTWHQLGPVEFLS